MGQVEELRGDEGLGVDEAFDGFGFEVFRLAIVEFGDDAYEFFIAKGDDDAAAGLRSCVGTERVGECAVDGDRERNFAVEGHEARFQFRGWGGGWGLLRRKADSRRELRAWGIIAE
jgi:hypothetical protein